MIVRLKRNHCSEVLDHEVQLYTLVSLQASMMYLSCKVNEYSLYIVLLYCCPKISDRSFLSVFKSKDGLASVFIGMLMFTKHIEGVSD